MVEKSLLVARESGPASEKRAGPDFTVPESAGVLSREFASAPQGEADGETMDRTRRAHRHGRIYRNGH
jgi:hypothetical protein